jgi:oligopeptide/dipeptide ABC transporter ATP-binding protein
MTVLSATDLRTTFGPTARPIRAVRGVSFDLDAGQTFVLLGESGSGKSVTARTLLRLYGRGVRIEGSIRLGTEELSGLTDRQMGSIRGRRIGMVPQDPSGALDPLRSIGGQLMEVLRVHRMVADRGAARVRARELLELVGIADPPRVLISRPHQLSGGMRQRCVIALAVAAEPELLIADEPTTALDVTVQAVVLDLFLELQQRTGMALLLVTHDVGVAQEMGGRVGVMYAGRLVETGAVADVLSRPRHPYTRGLLESLPTPDTPRGRLPVIPGRPPLTGEVASGCAFAARCASAQPSCQEHRPELVAVEPGRSAACPVLNPIPVAAVAG